jgi:hypothetical protein
VVLPTERKGQRMNTPLPDSSEENVEEMIEAERQQMFNTLLQMLHNCIWADENSDEGDKGMFVYMQNKPEAFDVQVFKINMDNDEARKLILSLANSIVEQHQHPTKMYN